MTPNEQVSSWDGDRENRWIAQEKLAHGPSFLFAKSIIANYWRGLFFYLAYSFGSWQITRFAK
jgi:hypothetical protein